MKISFQSKGNFENTSDWLKKVTSINDSTILNSIASEGVKSLTANTPRSTGETASGWVSKITSTKNGTEVAWFNNAHPEAEANIAKLIELGHGTRTGGYVQPQPYIKNAMKPVWDRIDNNVIKEMMK